MRKIGATLAAEAGATVAQLEAWYGWTGGRMASHYTRTANNKALAVELAKKLSNEGKVNNKRPHPKKGEGLK